jgi:hypothetical protein
MRLGCSASNRAWMAPIDFAPERGVFTPAPAG